MYTKNRFSGEKILKTPLKLIGAKTKWRDVLYKEFPEHKTYCEPFLGSGTVLIGKEPAQIECVGDLNSYAIDLFLTLQNDPESFWELLKIYRESSIWQGKDGFKKLKDRVTKTGLRLSRSMQFYLITKRCMNGIWRLNKKGECNSSYCGTDEGRGYLTKEWLDAVSARLKDVIIKNIDALELIDLMPDDESTFIFLDPPYYKCKTTYNGISWKYEDYCKLAEVLDSRKYKWLMTINDNPDIRELFSQYNIFEHDVNYSCSQTNAGRGPRPELIIKNY